MIWKKDEKPFQNQENRINWGTFKSLRIYKWIFIAVGKKPENITKDELIEFINDLEEDYSSLSEKDQFGDFKDFEKRLYQHINNPRITQQDNPFHRIPFGGYSNPLPKDELKSAQIIFAEYPRDFQKYVHKILCKKFSEGYGGYEWKHQ